MSARLTMVGVIKHASISKDHSNVDVMMGMNYHLTMIDYVLILTSVTTYQGAHNASKSALIRRDHLGVNVMKATNLIYETRRCASMKMNAW